MKILKHGNTKAEKKMRGTCNQCTCRVEVKISETRELVDRDTTSGSATRYVKCPECGHGYLWVK